MSPKAGDLVEPTSQLKDGLIGPKFGEKKAWQIKYGNKDRGERVSNLQ